MKNCTRLFLLLFGLFQLSNLSAQQFEGIITVENSDEKGINAVFTLKGMQCKMETTTKNGHMTVLKDRESGDRILLRERDGKKMAIKQNRKNDKRKKRMSNNGEVVSRAVPNMEVVMTKETRQFGDYLCTKAILANDTQEAIAWIAKDFDLKFDEIFPSLKRKNRKSRIFEQAFAAEGFIMAMTIKDLKTKALTNIKSTIEAQEIDDEVFLLPDGYRLTDLTDVNQLVKEAKGNAERMREIKQALRESRRQ